MYAKYRNRDIKYSIIAVIQISSQTQNVVLNKIRKNSLPHSLIQFRFKFDVVRPILFHLIMAIRTYDSCYILQPTTGIYYIFVISVDRQRLPDGDHIDHSVTSRSLSSITKKTKNTNKIK